MNCKDCKYWNEKTQECEWPRNECLYLFGEPDEDDEDE